MIDFACAGCGERFSVPDNAAGRIVRCKKCSKATTVPAPAKIAKTAAAPPTGATMRQRRLRSDHEQMVRAFEKWPHIRIESTVGNPPELYVLQYTVKGLEKLPRLKDPVPRQSHRVEVQLVSDYPRLGPKCRMLTPVFHPNIDAATICVGDHWTAGERLVDLVVRIGEMIAFQDYNIQSPLNGEAAMWADLNKATLPIDPRLIRPPEIG